METVSYNKEFRRKEIIDLLRDRQFCRDLRLLAYGIVKDEEEAKDIVQDAIQTIWTKPEQIRDTTRGYLYKSVKNAACQHNRTAKKRTHVELTNTTALNLAASDSDNCPFWEKNLFTFLKTQLTPAETKLFNFLLENGYEVEQAAEELNRSQSTIYKTKGSIKSKIYRFLKGKPKNKSSIFLSWLTTSLKITRIKYPLLYNHVITKLVLGATIAVVLWLTGQGDADGKSTVILTPILLSHTKLESHLVYSSKDKREVVKFRVLPLPKEVPYQSVVNESSKQNTTLVDKPNINMDSSNDSIAPTQKDSEIAQQDSIQKPEEAILKGRSIDIKIRELRRSLHVKDIDFYFYNDGSSLNVVLKLESSQDYFADGKDEYEEEKRILFIRIKNISIQKNDKISEQNIAFKQFPGLRSSHAPKNSWRVFLPFSHADSPKLFTDLQAFYKAGKKLTHYRFTLEVAIADPSDHSPQKQYIIYDQMIIKILGRDSSGKIKWEVETK